MYAWTVEILMVQIAIEVIDHYFKVPKLRLFLDTGASNILLGLLTVSQTAWCGWRFVFFVDSSILWIWKRLPAVWAAYISSTMSRMRSSISRNRQNYRILSLASTRILYEYDCFCCLNGRARGNFRIRVVGYCLAIETLVG